MPRRQRARSLARAHPWLVVATTTVLAVGLVELIGLLSGAHSHRFLLWNLFLAWIPLPLAAAAYAADRMRLGLRAIVPFLVAWLAFFPNAPYIVTDVIHFGQLNDRIGPGLDLATIAAAAGAGLLAGFASLYVVQRLVARRYGYAAARAVVVASLVLASLGVYIGRVLRWNSWDLIANPQAVAVDVLMRALDPLSFQRAWLGVALFAIVLILSYRPALRLGGFLRQ